MIARSLNKKESQLYAPLANIGSVMMDQDAMYIDIGRANYTPKDRLEGDPDGNRSDAEGDGESDSSSGDDEEVSRCRSRSIFFFLFRRFSGM